MAKVEIRYIFIYASNEIEESRFFVFFSIGLFSLSVSSWIIGAIHLWFLFFVFQGTKFIRMVHYRNLLSRSYIGRRVVRTSSNRIHLCLLFFKVNSSVISCSIQLFQSRVRFDDPKGFSDLTSYKKIDLC